ncbi:hypothetical protein MFIFM68171_05858 [Madurella fahalii]|uniref:Uncharacterized protein n=1 Tax=Madurella fahalii TaxID=1157608 RepID=A0ABQ0GCZ8_9PEZI
MTLFHLLALGSALIFQAVANPVGLSPGRHHHQQQQEEAAHSCATVRCAAGTRCIIVSGTPTCVPVPHPERRDASEEEVEAAACGPNVCASGQVCCNASCGICAMPGEACTEQACLGPQCGPDVDFFCPLGQVCCNESCGKCAPPGTPCTMEGCLPPPPDPDPGLGPTCGNTTCAAGETCCNPSCGICTKPDQGCGGVVCEDPPPVPGPGRWCGEELCLGLERCCQSESWGLHCVGPFEVCFP